MDPKTKNIDLKLMVFNAENLFLLFDQAFKPEFLNYTEDQWQKLSTSVFDNKPLYKSKAIAQIINETAPDLIMLCEVGGIESIKNFAEIFLNSEYSPALIEGNSDRHIDVGFLIKKNLPFYFDIHSNKNRTINYLYPHERDSVNSGYPTPKAQLGSHKFSRDVAELSLFTKSRDNPFFVSLLTHLKSPLDPEKVDPNGFERRQAELKTLVDIYLELEQKLKEQVPIVVTGDFNGNASLNHTDAEFTDLYQRTKLKDALELSNVPVENRNTFFHVKSGSRTEGKQIDFCFISPLASKFLSPNSFVYRYKDEFNMPIEAPGTLDEKQRLPSDHNPLIVEFKNIPLK